MKYLVPIMLGSDKDLDLGTKIKAKLIEFNIDSIIRICSANKSCLRLLKILDDYNNNENIKVYITIAGKSNALSALVEGNSLKPVISCPPLKDTRMYDIYSSISTPSEIAPLTVLGHENVAISVAKIYALFDNSIQNMVSEYKKSMSLKLHIKDIECRYEFDNHELLNKEILILGFGRIGKSLIKRCLSFDMKVKIYDPFLDAKTINEYGGEKVDDLDNSLKKADFVSIHMPLTEKTKNLINYNKLKTMKKNAIIINTARGGIIDEVDLDKALNEDLIFGAGLDVFAKEPIELDNPLIKNKKVLLSPHTATFTKECTSRMGIETAKNVIDFFENKIHKSMIVKL